MKSWFATLKTLIWKDLLQEWRSKDMLTAMLAFAILTIFIFNYAMELDPRTRASLAPGILWVVLTFSGTLGLNRSFVAEQEQGSFDALILAVPTLGSIWLAKQLSNFLVMLVLLAIILPVYSLLYNQNLFISGLLLILILGAWAFSAAGTLLASMTAQTRMRDLLLPVLLFPILMPVNMAVVKAGEGILSAAPLANYQIWITLLLVYGIIMTTISLMVFDYVILE
jgi:heme exporter protein B